MSAIKLSKADARRAFAAYQFRTGTLDEVFDNLRSVQFDPLSPVGCNHDLVLQARVPGYKIGDWQKFAYKERRIYDGWDKQASLVNIEGWPMRRIYHDWHRAWFGKIFFDHPHAVKAVLHELETRGALLPKEFEFQERKEDWKVSWHGPNLTKQTLRALWHAGVVMTTDRRGSNHIYDLTERVLPLDILMTPKLEHCDAVREIVLDRHKAVGMLRPSAPFEVWSFDCGAPPRKQAIKELIERGELVEVDVDGMMFHAFKGFLPFLDIKPEEKVRFIAPLDQFMWDRKAIAHLYGFDYIWEVYVPEAKRRWGYYVLPILKGDKLIARAEFWCREGTLTIRKWHWEEHCTKSPEILAGLHDAFGTFRDYCCATKIVCENGVDKRVKKAAKT